MNSLRMAMIYTRYCSSGAGFHSLVRMVTSLRAYYFARFLNVGYYCAICSNSSRRLTSSIASPECLHRLIRVFIASSWMLSLRYFPSPVYLSMLFVTIMNYLMSRD
jgi:hypothetical protein